MIKIFGWTLIAAAIAIEALFHESNSINYERGYDKGLEDGIRMTNEVIAEEVRS